MMEVRSIVELYDARRANRSEVTERMRIVSENYDGRIAIPLPELDRREQANVANLLAQGIDAHGQRIASVQPVIEFPAVRPNIQQSIDRARTRRRAAYGWWQTNDMNLLDYQRARWLIAYAQAPVVIVPSSKTRQPRWELRNPLCTYPAETSGVADMRPADTVFAYTRTYGWLTATYPDAAAVIARALGGSTKRRPDDTLELLTYIDDTEEVILVVGEGQMSKMGGLAEHGIGGARIVPLDSYGMGRGRFAVELKRRVNKAGVCPVVVPSRISLGEPKGQFDEAIGLFQSMAKLMAMEVNAVAGSIWPDVWVEGTNPQRAPQVVKVADGLQGKIGEIQDGKIVPVQLQPGFQTYATIDRIERAIRQTAALPAELGGESGSNIRTDRRGQSVLSAAIDFHIKEHQEILAAAKKQELEIAIAVDAAYFGRKPKSFFIRWAGEKGRVDYTPSKLWDDDRTVTVSYALAGADINQQIVAMGQAVGVGITSKRTAMRSLPWVDDPESEEHLIETEAVKAAILSAVQAQANAGALTLPDAAELAKQLRSGDVDFIDALISVHEKAQQRQASSGMPGTPEGPVPAGSPGAQPGIAAPGQGAESPSIGDVPTSMSNFQSLLGALAKGRAVARAS